MAVKSSGDYRVLDVISTKGKKHRVRLLRAQLPKPLSDGRTEVCVKTFTSQKYEVMREALAEAQTLMSASLKHQSICKMYDCYTEQCAAGYTFGIVMEYFPLGDLEDEIKYRKHHQEYWAEQELLKLFEQLVEALETLQREKICHRDIKPQNIFLATRSRLKIGDFGVSMRELTESSAQRTLVGTPIYFSPLCAQAFLSGEILREGCMEVRHNIYKSDVFSLGLTFLRMAGLRNIRGLNADSQGTIEARIADIAYSAKVQQFLRTMLTIDESARPDFTELSTYLKSLIAINLEPPIPQPPAPDDSLIARIEDQVQRLQSVLQSVSPSSVPSQKGERDSFKSYRSNVSTVCDLQSFPTDPGKSHRTERTDAGKVSDSLERHQKCATLCFGNILLRIGSMCGRIATVPASALS